MNTELGTVLTGIIIDENEDSFFVQKSGVTYRLSKNDAPESLEIGETVEGFVYESLNKEMRITTVIPSAKVGTYGWGTVSHVRRDLGVFVDIGLEDKEMVVSMDMLHELKSLWPKKGDRLLITLEQDDKGRVWGVLADEEMFQDMALTPKPEEDWQNKPVSGTIYRLRMSGSFLITDDSYIGFIHPTEREEEPRLGQHVEGRVIGVSPYGNLNVSLKPRAHEALEEDALMILALLRKNPEHTLPYNDKSDPEAIRSYFGISKAQFKRALGRLMKEKLIIQEDGMTKLVEK